MYTRACYSDVHDGWRRGFGEESARGLCPYNLETETRNINVGSEVTNGSCCITRQNRIFFFKNADSDLPILRVALH